MNMECPTSLATMEEETAQDNPLVTLTPTCLSISHVLTSGNCQKMDLHSPKLLEHHHLDLENLVEIHLDLDLMITPGLRLVAAVDGQIPANLHLVSLAEILCPMAWTPLASLNLSLVSPGKDLV